MSPVYPENALILAPLSGFTDAAYRGSARRCGCEYAFTEMVDAASLAYAAKRAEPMLLREEGEAFLGVQLEGAEPELFKIACERLNAFDFSLLDLNLGCPVPKVVKKGAGAALGRNPDLALKIFSVMARYSRFPLTAKLRIIDEQDPTPTLDLCRGLVELGAKALTIHGRTWEHFYTGEVHFEQIAAVREAFPEIPVIANGGVNSIETYEEMRRETGCSRVMLAQGAMGNPWLFRILKGGPDPSLAEWRQEVLAHVDGMIRLYGEETALVQARKIVHDYLKGRGFPGSARAAASGLTRRNQLAGFLASVEPVAPSTTRRIA